jgi:hypothetical protein
MIIKALIQSPESLLFHSIGFQEFVGKAEFDLAHFV